MKNVFVDRRRKVEIEIEPIKAEPKGKASDSDSLDSVPCDDAPAQKSTRRPASSIWSMTLMERENAAILLQSTTLRPFIYMSFPFRFKCFYCDQEQPELDTLLEHTKNHTVPDPAEMIKTILKKGKKTIKVDISELKCKLCDAPFPNIDEIRRHLSEKHEKKFNMASGNGMMAYYLLTTDGVFSCHLCWNTFTSFFLLNQHINVHYSNSICDTCGKGFISHRRLIQHQVIHLKGKYHCDKCGVNLDNANKLNYHNYRYHGETNRVKHNYKCPHCPKRVDHHYEKVQHMAEAHGINTEYRCETCNAVFKARSALTRHNIKHHLHSISCEVCGKQFAETSHLRKHMAAHSQERNHSCPLCTKAYKYEKNLKVHMKVHNPDWKFACAECLIGFSNKLEFKKHVEETHSKKSDK